MRNRRFLYGGAGIIAAIFGLIVFSPNVWAGAWTNDGNGASGGTLQACEPGTHTNTWGNCIGNSWIYYTYVKGANGKNTVYNADTPNGEGVGKFKIPNAEGSSGFRLAGNTISNKCGKWGGFWNLGYEVGKYTTSGSKTTVWGYGYQKGTHPAGVVLGSGVSGAWRQFYVERDKDNKSIGAYINKNISGWKTENGYQIRAVKYGTWKEVRAAYDAMEKEGLDPWKNVGSFCAGYGDPPYDEPQTKTGKFRSRSIVSYNGTKSDSGLDGSADFNADKNSGQAVEVDYYTSSVTVNFTHYITTDEKNKDYITAGASTRYTLKQTGYDAKTIYDNKKIAVANMNSNTDAHYREKILGNKTTAKITVELAVGQTKTICQKITYDPKNFEYYESKITSSSGSGGSSACITLHRSEKPLLSCASLLMNGTAHNQNYGNTKGISLAINHNLTPSTGLNDLDPNSWKSTVYAKPGDSIHFLHCLSYGAQAVRDGDQYIGRTVPSNVPQNWFKISASIDADSRTPIPDPTKYLFNRKFFISSPITITKATKIYEDNTTRSPNNNGRLSKTADFYDTNGYGVGFYFPRVAYANPPSEYEDAKFNCANYSPINSKSYQNTAFQIPGFASVNDYDQEEGCNSANKVEASSVGEVIKQTLDYNKIQAWVNYSYRYSYCGCNLSNSGWTRIIPTYQQAHDGAYSGTVGRLNNIGCYYAGNCGCCGPKCTSPCYASFSRYPEWVDYPVTYTETNVSTTASLKVPYNFKTRTSSSITGGSGLNEGVVYAGEEVESHFEVEIENRENQKTTGSTDSSKAYKTLTPTDTIVQVFSFTIDKSASNDASRIQKLVAGGVDTVANRLPISYISSLASTSNFKQLYWKQGSANPEGELYNDVYALNQNFSDVAPDIEVGSKYCVAVGISHADSHAIRPNIGDSALTNSDSDGESLRNTSPYWRISNVSCRTIAKKPNVQVWGGLYSNGNVTTAISNKKFDGVNGATTLFGSWTDTLAIGGGNNTLKGLTSGAALGYNYTDNGGGSTTTDYCKLAKITIANTNCSTTKQTSGASGIATGSIIDQLIAKVKARYASDDSKYDATGTVGGSLGSAQNLTSRNGSATYLHFRNNANLGATLTRSSGTLVIKVNGTLTIDHNICSGSGSCSGESNVLNLLSRNSNSYADVDSIPQVIIIANNVDITDNVTQIDAWIIADGGQINTCTAATAGAGGNTNADTCSKTLTFNGPIFAKKMVLNRTAGAFPGRNTSAASANKDLASANPYGSVVPAEIFNLRPDVYLWSYAQANRLTQATTTYTRELAPRY